MNYGLWFSNSRFPQNVKAMKIKNRMFLNYFTEKSSIFNVTRHNFLQLCSFWKDARKNTHPASNHLLRIQLLKVGGREALEGWNTYINLTHNSLYARCMMNPYKAMSLIMVSSESSEQNKTSSSAGSVQFLLLTPTSQATLKGTFRSKRLNLVRPLNFH